MKPHLIKQGLIYGSPCEDTVRPAKFAEVVIRPPALGEEWCLPRMLGSEHSEVRNGQLKSLVGGFPRWASWMPITVCDLLFFFLKHTFSFPSFLWLWHMGRPVTKGAPSEDSSEWWWLSLCWQKRLQASAESWKESLDSTFQRKQRLHIQAGQRGAAMQPWLASGRHWADISRNYLNTVWSRWFQSDQKVKWWPVIQWLRAARMKDKALQWHLWRHWFLTENHQVRWFCNISSVLIKALEKSLRFLKSHLSTVQEFTQAWAKPLALQPFKWEKSPTLKHKWLY